MSILPPFVFLVSFLFTSAYSTIITFYIRLSAFGSAPPPVLTLQPLHCCLYYYCDNAVPAAEQ